MHSAAVDRFAVLNDFEAVGYGVSVVPESDTIALNDTPVVHMVNSEGACALAWFIH